MDIATLQRPAGINESQGIYSYEGSNISVTGTEKRRIEREKFASGDEDWSQTLVSPRPYWKGQDPSGLRGRKKSMRFKEYAVGKITKQNTTADAQPMR